MQVPGQIPELSDDELELLRRLAEAPGADGLPGTGTSFTEALRNPKPLDGMSTKALARPTINKAARELGQLTGTDVTLLQPDGRRGTFATSECHALSCALAAVARERERVRVEAMRRRQLEWLQLASCLDNKPLRIGSYQAHAERFLAMAGELMAQYFPWIDFRIVVEKNRQRSEHSRGVIRESFDEGRYDAMLVPRDSEKRHLDVVYSYSFRVVGATERLRELKDKYGVIDVIDIHKLCGEKLLVGPSSSSSRQRVRALFRDAGVDIEDGSVELIEDANPSSLRIRAQTGEGLAIMSDEYTAVGGSRRDFPYLGLGLMDNERPRVHVVEMGLLTQAGADKPRHKAFNFVIEELVAREKVHARAAALD